MCRREIEVAAPGRTTRELAIRQCRPPGGRNLSERRTERDFSGPNIFDLLLLYQPKIVAHTEEMLASSDNVRE